MLLLAGCSVISVLKGEPPKDVSSIVLGISKHDVETVLGSPIREWLTPSNAHFSVYMYNGGVPTDYSDALAIGIFEIVGAILLFEFSELISESSITKMAMNDSRIYVKMAISYNDQNQVISVFDHFNDFDALPSSGQKSDSSQ